MERESRFDAVLIWVLSILLAGLFLLDGASKLFGIQMLAVPAAAVRGFPAGIPYLVGLLEIAGAIALLVPAAATFGALALAGLMLPAALTQWMRGDGQVWLPLTILALLLVIAWRRNATTVRARRDAFQARPHRTLYDGMLAGLVGAAVIALWFLIIDTIDGRPLFTPATLGRGLLGVLAPGEQAASVGTLVSAYTVFHVLAFLVVGLLAAYVAGVAEREPSILFGFLMLFAAVEVGIYVLVAILDVATPLGSHAWLPIMVGNLIAIVTMGAVLWRRRPALREQFRRSLDREPGSADQLLSPPGMR
ncbi:MAG: DoxX family protein [Gemmatirosa sp.]